MINNKKGILYGVGVGPGNPELMTLKATRIINECSFIALPGKSRDKSKAYTIAKGAIVNLDDKEYLCLDLPMTSDEQILMAAHERAAGLIVEKLSRGEDVAFLTLGDVLLYSTFAYIKKIVEDKGYKTQMVSGITSFSAAAAIIGEELVTDTKQLHIIPMTDNSEDFWKLSGTKVLMKASANYARTKEILKAIGKRATLITNVGMENEKVFDDVCDFPEETGYFSIIIIWE